MLTICISLCVCATTDKTIKLGLGDFIFYSVLVGRAAIYDFSTFAATFICIVMVQSSSFAATSPMSSLSDPMSAVFRIYRVSEARSSCLPCSTKRCRRCRFRFSWRHSSISGRITCSWTTATS